MKLTNEFTVGADVDRVWKTLLDMEGVAGCLPGATIEPADEENAFHGSMRMKIGPMTVTYKGTATLTEVDEQARRAVIALRAREAKGQGTAMATITNVVEPANGGARVRAETDLQITGAQARFGRGVMEDVAERVLGEFSSRLERQILGESGAAQASAGAGRQAPGAQEVAAGDQASEALDVGALLSGTMRRHARVAVPALVLLVAVLVLLLRR